MSSLSITAGRDSKKNFYYNPETYVYTRARSRTNGSSWSGWSAGGVSLRDFSIDSYRGKSLKDFHKRRAAGELLPFTQYLYLNGTRTVSGPSRILTSFSKPYGGGTGTGDNEIEWDDSSSKPLCFHTAGAMKGYLWATTPYYLLDELGIDPKYYAQLAAAKLYSKGWDALTFVAEIHKTVRMFRSCVLQLASLWDAYTAELSRKGAKWAAGVTFNAWLEGRYGWRILLFDIEDISNVLRSLKEKSKTRYSEQVGANRTISTSISDVAAVYYYFDLICDTQIDLEVGARGHIVADFIPANISFNPFVTGWELTRYSFVLDWLYSVGNALSALSFLTVADQYTCSTGVACSGTVTNTYSVSAKNGAWGETTTASGCTAIGEFSYRNRKPCYVPTSPIAQVNLSIGKITDLIALLGQIALKLT